MTAKINFIFIFRGFTALGFIFISLVFLVAPAHAEVVLLTFTALPYEEEILLEWEALSETNNQGFYVLRSDSLTGQYNRLMDSYQITQSDDSPGPYFYFYIDSTVEEGRTYFYKLEAVDLQLVSEFFGPVSATAAGETPVATSTSFRTPTPTEGPRPTSTPIPGFATATRAPGLQPTSTRIGAGQPSPTSRTPTLQPTQDETELVETDQPDQTATLAPLPEIELVFPETPTVALSPTTASELQQSQATELPGDSQDSGASWRMPVLVGLIGFLWLCLGIFLVVAIRRFSRDEN
jgi:hypothetical protein